MTAKDRHRLRRLEIENEYLREKLDQMAQINRNNLYEIVDLKTTLDIIKAALLDTSQISGNRSLLDG
jgi:hypothetical protein